MSKDKHRIGESAFDGIGADYDSIESLREIKLDLIDPPLWQPRKQFEREKLEELKNSIKEHGLLQPLVLEKTEGNRYRIVSGERRYRALKELNIEFAHARIISDLTEEKRLQIQIAENLIREDITPIERSKAIYKLLSTQLGTDDLNKILNTLVDYGKDKTRLKPETANTVLAVLKGVGKSHMTLYRWLQLLKLPDEILQKLDDPNGFLTPKHAGELLKLEDAKSQIELVELIEKMNLSVDQTKDIVEKESKSKGKKIYDNPNWIYKAGKNFIQSLSMFEYNKLQSEEKVSYLNKIEQLKEEIDKIISNIKKMA